MSLDRSMTSTSITDSKGLLPKKCGRCNWYKPILFSFIFLAAVVSTIIILSGSKALKPESCTPRKNCKTGDVPKYDSLTSFDCGDVCETKSCLKTASYILERMDTSYDPCDDFYMYSCGNFQKTALGEDAVEMSFITMSLDIFRDLKSLIEDSPKTKEDDVTSSFNKVKDIYESCMNLHSADETAMPTMKKFFEKARLHNWPFLEPDFHLKDADLEESLSLLHMYGIITFFDMYFRSDKNSQNSEGMDLKFKHAWGTVLSRYGNITKESVKRAELRFQDFGLSSEEIEEILEDLQIFDLKFSNLTEDARAKQQECRETDCTSPKINCTTQPEGHWKMWCNVQNLILDKSEVRQEDRTQLIYVSDEAYFQRLYDLLQNTSSRVLGYYLGLDILSKYSSYMQYKIRGSSAEQSSLSGTRWAFCISGIVERIPMILGAKYYASCSNDTKFDEVRHIYSDLKESILSIVDRNSWIDQQLSETIMKEVEGINMTAEAYIKLVSNYTVVDEYFKKLNVSNRSFLANVMEVQRFRTMLFFKSHPDAELKARNPFNVMAAYDGESIHVELGIFVFPMLMSRRPRYTNVGMIGFVLGHELGHIVERGLRNSENKSENFEKEFLERFHCIADQYSEFEIDFIKVKVDGNSTFGDNVADQIGTRAAYMAFRRHQENHGREGQLPGLHFSEEQMFFLSLSQIWCEKSKLSVIEKYADDVHSPPKFRIVGTFRNLEEFSEAFHCPVGSPMNPEAKCIVVS